LPPLPDFNVPRFFRRIALSTLLPAALPYFRPLDFFPERFVAAMVILPVKLVEKNSGKGCRNIFSCNVLSKAASKHPNGWFLVYDRPKIRLECFVRNQTRSMP
jgi:hypothetical protein